MKEISEIYITLSGEIIEVDHITNLYADIGWYCYQKDYNQGLLRKKRDAYVEGAIDYEADELTKEQRTIILLLGLPIGKADT